MAHKKTMEEVKKLLERSHRKWNDRKRKWYECYFTGEHADILIIMCFFIGDSDQTTLKVWMATNETIDEESLWSEFGEIKVQVKQSTAVTFENQSIFYFAENDHKIYRHNLVTGKSVSIIKGKNPFVGLSGIEILVLRFLKDHSALEIKYIAGFGRNRSESQKEIHNIWN